MISILAWSQAGRAPGRRGDAASGGALRARAVPPRPLRRRGRSHSLGVHSGKPQRVVCRARVSCRVLTWTTRQSVGATGARPPYALDDIVQAVVSAQHFVLTVYYEMHRLRDINYAKVRADRVRAVCVCVRVVFAHTARCSTQPRCVPSCLWWVSSSTVSPATPSSTSSAHTQHTHTHTHTHARTDTQHAHTTAPNIAPHTSL